jgi:hypothetical protein
MDLLAALLLVVLAVVIWGAISDLRRRVSAIEARTREREGALPLARPEGPTPALAPAMIQPPAQEPAPKPAAASAPAPAVATALPVEANQKPVVTTAPAEPRRPTAPSTPSRPSERAEPAVAAVTVEHSEGWELEVGTSWLSKIGALVVVIGVALFTRYAFARVTPVGRVTSGYAVTIAMLGFGVVLERRDRYRNYAYALIAGGWAGIYFMTYAMHAVDATRLIDDELIAASSLALVAMGMIAHSLRYRSPVVTTLAYVVAYATLALTPLSGFSLAASIPLSVSVIVVAQRFNWSHVSMAGLVSTYGLFAIRGVVFAGGVMDAQGIAPYLTLACYWVTFEVADILALRRARASATTNAPLFALNTVGLIGAAVIELPMDDPIRVSWLLAAAGIGFLASALVRARVLGRQTVESGGTTAVTFGTVQGSMAVAAALFAWAVVMRFSGRREVLVLLLEAEMLVASGFALGDRYIRLIGSACGVLVTVFALQLVPGDAMTSSWLPWPVHTWTAVLALVAVAWYANREWLRGRRDTPLGLEYGYTWIASGLVLIVFAREFSWLHAGMASLLFSAALVEAGLRRGREYRYQAYFAALAAAEVIFPIFLLTSSTVREAWIVLPASVVTTYFIAARLGRRAGSSPGADLSIAAAAMACLGTALLAVFEWRVLAEAHVLLVGPAWALTALTCLGVGIWRPAPVLRWHGYLLLFAAAARALQPILQTTDAPTDAIVWMSLVIAALYGASLASRRAIGLVGGTGGPGAQLEDTCRLAVSMAATCCLTVLIVNEVRSSLVTLAWGAEGIGLLALGLPLRERVMRLSGLGLLFLCTLKLFTYDLSELEAFARIFSFVGLGVVLLGVSWAYTRYQEQIKRLL